jgi:hypothetical protein
VKDHQDVYRPFWQGLHGGSLIAGIPADMN